MTGRRCPGLLAALLLAGITLRADGFQDTLEDPPSGGALEREPAVTDETTGPPRSEDEFRQRLNDAHAEWTAKVRAEQARIDRYQLRNFFGDRVQLEHVAYVVNEIEFIDEIDVGMEDFSQRAGEGHVFCIVDMTVNNVSDISNIASLGQSILIDAGENRYPVDEDAIFALKLKYKKTLKRPVTFHWRIGRLQPGIPGRAQLVYRIPADAAQTDLGLEIVRRKDSVLVRLEERPEDDPPRVERPVTASWWIGEPIRGRPKPVRIKQGLNEWLSLTKSAHVITGIDFQDDLGSRRSLAPEEGIYLRIDSILENSTDVERNSKGTSSFVVSAENGRLYRPVRVEVPTRVPGRETVTMKSFFLLPVSIVEGRLDLLIYQSVWDLSEPGADTYGWINLKP